MKKYLYLITFIVILFCSCLKKIDDASLFGKYHFNTGASDSLILYKNHTYRHWHINSKGKVYEVHGKWNYNGQSASFHDFNFFNDLGTTGGDGIWVSDVERENNRIKLIESDDDNSGFIKD